MSRFGAGYQETLKSIRAMREGGYDSSARGWLREILISMSLNHVLYRDAVCDVREGLLNRVADKDLYGQIETRLIRSGRLHGTLTIDLTDEEAMLAKAFFGTNVLEYVAKTWLADKDYELAIRKMETFVSPGDVPPSREGGAYRNT